MKRIACLVSTAVGLIVMDLEQAMAQSVPRLDRVSPSQLQQLSRDLVPSRSQDFFKAGQASLEQEIQRFTCQRPNDTLLKVNPGVQLQPTQREQPILLPHDQAR